MSAVETVPQGATLLSRITSNANLRLAWRRARQHFTKNFHFVDHVAVADFRRNLDSNLDHVACELSSGRYRIAPLRLAPQPKHKLGVCSPIAMRETFWLEPRDQVAWLAVANVVGPLLDNLMPAWSYGHRLSDGNGVRGDRPDCDPSDYFVWSPNESWPICQRHVVLTARHMRAGGPIDPAQLSYDERIAWQWEMDRSKERRIPYWNGTSSRDGKSGESAKVYYATFDFKSFSNGLRLDDVRRVMLEHLPDEARLLSLINSMLEFDVAETASREAASLADVRCSMSSLIHLPVGLIAQGFLANVAMLPIDGEASSALGNIRVAHFRFFDDHFVLACDPGTLCDWLRTYQKIVRRHVPTLEFNAHKTRPTHLGEVLIDESGGLADRQSHLAWQGEECLFDPDAPSKLWALSPVVHRTAASSSNPWTLQLTCTQLEMIRNELRRPFTKRVASHGDLIGHFEDPTMSAIFARMRLMIVELPAKRILLRQALMFLAQTGVGGLGLLFADLIAQAERSPAIGASQVSLFFQLLAPLLPVVALRAARSSGGIEEQSAANAFFLDLATVDATTPASGCEWYLERSLESYICGLLIARAILVSHQANVEDVRIIGLMDELLEASSADLGHARRAEDLLMHWNDLRA